MLFSSLFMFLLMFSFVLSKFQMLMFLFLLMFMVLSNISILNWSYSNLNSVFFFMDYMGYLLSCLSFMVMLYIYMLYYDFNKDLKLVLNLMLISLCFCFFSNSMIILYIFFEFSMLPLLVMILLLGGSLERFKASLYLLIYTLAGSLIFLVFYLCLDLDFYVNTLVFFKFKKLESLFFINLMLVFFIKMPLYSLHLWLPKAHVEAPVGGSMILASVLLKLGVFGLSRIFMGLNLYKIKEVMNIMFIISLLGSLYCGLICLRQLDVKILIAYSSVSHMGLLLGGLLSFSKIGSVGSILIVMGHGFCSSALFFMGNLFYERFKTRNLYLYKGGAKFYPILWSFWLIFSVFNMSAPPSLNFLGEVLLVFSILNKSLMLTCLITLILFFSVAYSLILFMQSGHGISWEFNYMKKESFLDMFIMLNHLIWLLIYVLKMICFVN